MENVSVNRLMVETCYNLMQIKVVLIDSDCESCLEGR